MPKWADSHVGLPRRGFVAVYECLIDIKPTEASEDLLEPIRIAGAAGVSEASVEGRPDAGAPLLVLPLLEAEFVDLSRQVFRQGEGDAEVVDEETEFGQLQ